MTNTVIGGENVGPRRIEWNFVATSETRLESAINDWKSGRFPKVPGDSEEFIPFPGGD
ncbi:pirin-like C-terminal cupin domain-containing protein [Microbulbifer celer]|uniref:Pirin-like C-terminal cupin domain-containing protein n=1 Tax=Microbulbifer celer TaxID=435905 RepID=A0ABW3UCD8_9GAMM|nr:pirin-like C-terminal cupin domain-containing protein [Microbulbifer celer]UFN59117.1 hypothetical protein LPW13_08810 [Microbulbifer celer]